MLARLWLFASITSLLVAALPGAARAQSYPLSGLMFDSAVNSPILRREMPYRVYLPPDYFWSDSRRYPVLYMLHGAGGNYTEWSDSFLPQQIDRLIVHGMVQPMIVVMPEGDGRTFFANWDNGPRYSDYIVQDVVAEVDARYRTVATHSSRAIGGLSMGGVAALQLAMRNPNVFGVAGAHSPSIRLEPDADLWFLSGQTFLQHDPIWLSRNWPGTERITYWLDVGTEDWWRPNIETLHGALLSSGFNLTWRVYPGTHEAEYWIEHLPDYLRFYSEALRAG
jgi:enterochelin esterase-like enzyme